MFRIYTCFYISYIFYILLYNKIDSINIQHNIHMYSFKLPLHRDKVAAY